MKRRVLRGLALDRALNLVLGLLFGCMAPAALAQAMPQPAPQATATEAAPAALPRPAPVQRRARVPGAAKPAPLEVTKLPPQQPPPGQPNLRVGSLAPVPDRNMEAPRAPVQDRASLGPSVINRNLPGRGQASDGGPSLLEDKLFRPAPGARLNLPFSY